MTAVIIPPTNRVVLQGIHWETYRALVQDLESQAGKRLTYDNGMLEITMPLPPHEHYKRLLGRFVEVATEEMGIEICSLGSCTWSREVCRQGLEPDECYYIQNELAVRGKRVIDLNVEPPPDLVIEIDITSSSLNRLAIYTALGVPEVWRFDEQTVSIYQRGEDGYELRKSSTALPLLGGADLLRFLVESQSMGETTLIRTFRQWVRERLAAGT